MKLIVYIIALVAICGAAFMSMQNISNHEEQLTLTKEGKVNVTKKKVQVANREEERKTEEGLRNEENERNRELIATEELKQKDKRDVTNQSEGFDADLERLLGEKEVINQTIAEIERELEGVNVPLDEVESFVTNLEDTKKDLNKTNIALLEETDEFTGFVANNKAVLTDFQVAQGKRRANLNANKISSLITAVDNEWGFVVVKPHEGAMIKSSSKLVVVRGNKHIGRLNINAIEGEAGRVLANIDYSSLVKGMKIRPGDRVILSEPLTR